MDIEDLHWPTVDEGLDTAALTSVSLMLLGRRNATTGGSGNNLASVSLFSISLYSKPTDKHQYLSPCSCHPKHCFKRIPFSQAIRVKRLCSTVETTKQRLGDLNHHLKRRGYNDKVRKDILRANVLP
jgi:hypothetical protein